MANILGLDIGTNSIGWALLNAEFNSEDKLIPTNIIDMGVRIFESGVDGIGTTKEAVKNAVRRDKRLTRRQTLRRKRRKIALIHKLIELGFINEKPNETFYQINPYELRKKALYEELSLLDLARALYHLNQRRGYKSNRLAGADKEDGAIYAGDKKAGKTGITELQNELNGKTIGEYLSELNPHERRIRNRYTLRSMYEEEYDRIMQKQCEYKPDFLLPETIKRIREIIFNQRPMKSQKGAVGFCPFEPKKKRARKSHPLFQEFRALQTINMLRISGAGRFEDEDKKLTMDEREKLLNYLSCKGDIDLKDNCKKLKEILGLKKDARYQFNLEGRSKLESYRTFIDMKKKMGKEFDKFDYDEHLNIYHCLIYAENNDWLIKYLQEKFDISETAALELSKIKLEKDYGSLSIKAINKILPFLRDGELYHDAAKHAEYEFNLYHEKEGLDVNDIKITIKEKIENSDIPRLSNTIVMSALHQIKAVVNAIIERYGAIDSIRIEMARELSMNKEERGNVFFDNQKRNKRNEEIKNILLKECNINSPSPADIVKYKLWEECHHICPYTGKSIGLKDIYGDNVRFEIEHILPYQRFYDDSFTNKTLSCRDFNREKSKRTPYEVFTQSRTKEQFTAFKERIKDLPFGKQRRMLSELNEDDEKEFSGFLARQLNDTKYIARETIQLLKLVANDVTACKGNVTALLRSYWGLSKILAPKKPEEDVNREEVAKKNREDHRHHAIDALVIALADRSVIQRLSTYHKAERFKAKELIKEENRQNYLWSSQSDLNFMAKDKADKELEKHFPIPWEHFWNEAKTFTDRIIVSHKFNGKARGQLHEETNYGKLYDSFGNAILNEKKIPQYVFRKPIESLTENEMRSIRDEGIKRIVFERLISLGIDVSSDKFKIPKGVNPFAEPLFISNKNGTKTQIKTVRIVRSANNMIQLRKEQNLFVEPGSNHHIIIYSENGKKQGKVVSRFVAANRKTNKLPIIDTLLEPEQEFIMSLQRNEMVLLDYNFTNIDFRNKQNYRLIYPYIYRLQKMTQDLRIYFRLHSTIKSSDTDTNSGINLDNLQSVEKDNIANDKFRPIMFVKSPNTLQVTKIIIDPIGFIKLA